MDIGWFTGQLQHLVASLKLDPRSLTIFLTDNAFLFAGNPGKCCIVGFHSGLLSSQADTTQLHTYVWASYSDTKIFDFSKMIYAARAELADAFPDGIKIESPSTDKDEVSPKTIETDLLIEDRFEATDN